ncbi:hypothetical protein ABZZ17_33620 [Streptomyces sp. NPDC006512]|uniref:hypothetical protein n=1 Tax=Streptomyces sp. NPDC006512 TaxID=3154307 RepID=UPI0033A3CFCB
MSARPARARASAVAPGRRGGPVRARFRFGELPGVTVRSGPAGRVAGPAARRALAEAGLGHLGGHLELRTPGRAPRAADLTRAARRAVTRALAARPRP